MSQRKKFVALAMADGGDMARIYRGFGIRRKTGYRWLSRYLGEEDAIFFENYYSIFLFSMQTFRSIVYRDTLRHLVVHHCQIESQDHIIAPVAAPPNEGTNTAKVIHSLRSAGASRQRAHQPESPWTSTGWGRTA